VPPPRALFIHRRLRCPSSNSSRPHSSHTPPPHLSSRLCPPCFSHFVFFYRSFYLLFSAAQQNLVTDNNLTLTDAVQRSHIYIRYYAMRFNAHIHTHAHTHTHTRTHTHAHTCVCVCMDPTFYCVYFGVTSRLCCAAAGFLPTFLFIIILQTFTGPVNRNGRDSQINVKRKKKRCMQCYRYMQMSSKTSGGCIFIFP